MTSTLPTFGFPVPLTSKVWAKAQSHIHPKFDADHNQKEFRKKLALYAVEFYLRCMAFKIEPKASDSHDPILSKFLESADLMVQGYGKLECCPVLAGDTSAHVPIDAQGARLAYVIVQLEEHYQQAQILGFNSQLLSANGEIDLHQIQPIDELPQFLFDCKTTVLQKIWRWSQEQRQALTALSEPLRDTCSGWQLSPDLNLAYMRFASDDAAEPPKSQSELPVVVSKIVQVQDLDLKLVMYLAPEQDGKFQIEIMVEPVMEQTLSDNLQLAIIDEAGQIFQQLSVSNHEGDLVTRPFSATPGEHFSVELILGSAKHTESFVI